MNNTEIAWLQKVFAHQACNVDTWPEKMIRIVQYESIFDSKRRELPFGKIAHGNALADTLIRVVHQEAGFIINMLISL